MQQRSMFFQAVRVVLDVIVLEERYLRHCIASQAPMSLLASMLPVSEFDISTRTCLHGPGPRATPSTGSVA